MSLSLFQYLGIQSPDACIDWEIDPVRSYGLFECRSPGNKVTDVSRRYYYFVIDAWIDPPRLLFMERGIRFAKILAHIHAPDHLIHESVYSQGFSCKDKNYAVTGLLCDWIDENILEKFDASLIIKNLSDSCVTYASVIRQSDVHDHVTFNHKKISLRTYPTYLCEEDVDDICTRYDFYESCRNPDGAWRGNFLINPFCSENIFNQNTGLSWQRGGTSWGFYRRICTSLETLQRASGGGLSGWRLPTLEEAMSLLIPGTNDRGMSTHSFFDSEQGFIYTADRRRPGGYWFVDLRHARVFWAGGTFSGGFGRFCCSTSATDARE